MDKKAEISEVDWSKVRIGNVYLSTLSPEERQKYEAWLTPEKRAELKREAELEDQDMEYWRSEGDKIDADRMKEGMPARSAIAALRRLAQRQGLGDEELMARSGLDAAALASIAGRVAVDRDDRGVRAGAGEEVADCAGRR